MSAPETLCRFHPTDGCELILSQGDLTTWDGVDDAIHRAAGPALYGQPTWDAWLAAAENHLSLVSA